MRIAAASVTATAPVVRARSTRRGSKHVYEKNTTENRLNPLPPSYLCGEKIFEL